MNKQRTTLFIKASIVKQVKAQAILEGMSMTSLVEKALLNYLPKKTVFDKIKLKGGEKK